MLIQANVVLQLWYEILYSRKLPLDKLLYVKLRV